MAETTGSTPTAPARKPASRSKVSARKNPSSTAQKNRGGAKTRGATPNATPTANAQDDWRGFNRVVSRYLGKHPESSIDETTIDQVMQYGRTLRQQGQKAMTAGGGGTA